MKSQLADFHLVDKIGFLELNNASTVEIVE